MLRATWRKIPRVGEISDAIETVVLWTDPPHHSQRGDRVPYNTNWLALIVVLCFVVALVLNQVLPLLRSSKRDTRLQLTLIGALLCFLAVFSGFPALAEEFGPLWPRGLAFSAIVVTCLLAFGLYNSRQRTQPSGVLGASCWRCSCRRVSLGLCFISIPAGTCSAVSRRSRSSWPYAGW